ncbi:MAG: MFS transporter [Gammaproteobacteria bacterium]
MSPSIDPSPPPSTAERRRILAWALYDWGNSAFATAVLAGFFPVYFKEWWSAGTDPTESSYLLGLTTSAASLVVLLLAPMLGALADQGGYKKRFVAAFTLLGAGACAALPLVGQGQWQYAALLYVAGGVGFGGAIVFYDALLISVTTPDRYDRVSAWGYALGYLGGGVIFAACVAATRYPQAFGLDSAQQAVEMSFVAVATWWLVFTVPLLRAVPEPRAAHAPGWMQAARAAIRQLAATARAARGYRQLMLFLAAYWLYIDGVDTVVRMAVDYGLALGFQAGDLIAALLLTQFVGFPAAVAFGRLADRFGARRMIQCGLCVYAGITLWAYTLRERWEFYALAAVIGLVQGGVQSLSRSLYARLIPADAAAEFFAFYNFFGKFAAIIGPTLMGWVALASGSSRLSVLSLLVLFIAGGLLLSRVNAR